MHTHRASDTMQTTVKKTELPQVYSRVQTHPVNSLPDYHHCDVTVITFRHNHFATFSAWSFYSSIIIMECHYLKARSLQKYTLLNGPTVFFVIQITAKGVGLTNTSDEQWMLKLFQLQYQTISNYEHQTKTPNSLLTTVTLWSAQDRNTKSYPPRIRHR